MVAIQRFDLALEVRTLAYQCLSGSYKLDYFPIKFFFNYMSFIWTIRINSYKGYEPTNIWYMLTTSTHTAIPYVCWKSNHDTKIVFKITEKCSLIETLRWKLLRCQCICHFFKFHGSICFKIYFWKNVFLMALVAHFSNVVCCRRLYSWKNNGMIENVLPAEPPAKICMAACFKLFFSGIF